MLDARESGVLLSVSSLPSAHGHGDLGPEARAFIDFLAAAGQRVWQVLPIHPVGPGNSPYSGASAFAGNPLLLSLEGLREEGLLSARELARGLPQGRIRYDRARRHRAPLLRRAFARFNAAGARYQPELAVFRKQARYWLQDYCLFMALHAAHGARSFVAWERPLVLRRADALREARAKLAGEIAYYEFEQFFFARQWRALRAYARSRNVRLIGDIPIFVAHDSADVWAHPESFQLDAQRKPRFVSGVPPDYFSADGQLWGTPLYNWKALARAGYAFWIQRFARSLELFDLVRLDHFIGFCRYWQVPRGASTARHGRWQRGPGRALFDAARQRLGALSFIAEDLGEAGDDVFALRDTLGLPGMRVLQLGFASDARDPFLPHNYTPNAVAYPGTHDNDTLLGWLAHASARERAAVRAYLGARAEVAPHVLAEGLLRALYASPARLVIVPLQDVLGLDNRARMNIPGRARGNWEFRLARGQANERVSAQLRKLSEPYGRALER